MFGDVTLSIFSIQTLTARTISVSGSGNDPAHDPLKLPNGKTIKETPTDELRSLLARFGITDAHTAPRTEIVARYAAVIEDVFNRAGEAAVNDFLSERRRYE